MAENKARALDAIYAEIITTVDNINGMRDPSHRAVALRDVAIAYRAAAGGPQPGSVPASSD